MQITNGDGVSTVQAADNDRKVSIVHRSGRDIKMSITEPERGGNWEKTTEYKAADAAELRVKHPEVAPLFEKYAGNPAPVPVPAGPAGDQPFRLKTTGAVPAVVPAPPQPNPAK